MLNVRCILIGAALLAAAPLAHADEWVKIGSRQVAFGADRDTIPAAHKGFFKKIKLLVKDNAVHVDDLKVHYGNGGVQDVAIRTNIPMGGATRVIDLDGGRRQITRIVMTYRTKLKRPLKRGKAEVVVLGLLAEPGGGPAVTPKPDAAKPDVERPKKIEWELLGSRDVKFSAEQDTIPVTALEGRFAKLKLKVLENGVHMIDLRLFYGNGGEQDVSLRADIPKGGETRVIDLDGGARVIKKIRLRYKSKGGVRGLLRGHATVKVFGLRVAGGGAVAEAPKPAVTPQPAAGTGKWEKLGEKMVKNRAEFDFIPVTAAEGRFTALRFKVKNSAIQMLDMKVHYRNGDVQDVPLRFNIPADGESRVIDLDGNKRIIQKVVFFYKGVRDGKGRATVALWGRH